MITKTGMMKLFGFVVLTLSTSLFSCTNREDRKLAGQEITERATNTHQGNTIKTASASELDSQFKGCKAHW